MITYSTVTWWWNIVGTWIILPFVRRSKRNMSKFHVPTFDNICCNKKTNSCQNWFRFTQHILYDTEWCRPVGLHLCLYVDVSYVYLLQLVPGSRRPGGVGTRGCGEPTPSAAWSCDSISGSSEGASLFSWCQTLPPPAGCWLKLQTICNSDRNSSDKHNFRISWIVHGSVLVPIFLVMSSFVKIDGLSSKKTIAWPAFEKHSVHLTHI